MSYPKNYLSWFNFYNRKFGWLAKFFFFFFYVNIPCMKYDESCRILKIIYHGLISTIGNMDRWQNFFFFLC